MFANYESSSDIKDLLVTIRNAIDKKLEIIDIKDDFDRVNNYRIFYNFEDLLSYDELELHVFVGYDELTMQEPKETIVIAFDFKIKSLLQNKTILYDSLCLNNIIFIHSSDLSFNIFDDDEKDLNIEVEANINKLYMIDCLFFKPITLAFDWDTIDLSSCIFLDSLSIYDLYNEFSSYYCNFDVIFMENHIFNKLEFNSCEAKRLELYPDQQDLDMEVININYSRLEELVINSREYYNREYHCYDIEVDSIKVIDSDIKNLIISDVQVDRLDIKRSNIYNLVLNEVLTDNDFVFKNLCVDNSEFTNTFVRGKEILGIDKNLKSNVNLIDYDKYIKDLQVLSDLNESPQSRGFAFEKYLKDLFEMNGLQPRGSFKIEGEQIDGSFILHDGIYLLEAKWTNKLIDKGELVIFNEKVSSKSGFTRGLYISYSGYSEGALKTLSTGRTVNIVLMTVQELEEVLLKKKDFKEFLWAKVRALAEEGNFNKSIVL